VDRRALRQAIEILARARILSFAPCLILRNFMAAMIARRGLKNNGMLPANGDAPASVCYMQRRWSILDA
jgi:hypothetical protein